MVNQWPTLIVRAVIADVSCLYSVERDNKNARHLSEAIVIGNRRSKQPSGAAWNLAVGSKLHNLGPGTMPA